MRQITFGKPMIGEEEKKAVVDVLNGPILVHGPKSVQFEEKFAHWTGAPHAVSVSSCTAAMHLFYFHLGLKPGDEVIVPAQTHTATAHAVEFTGAKPVFVDSEATTGNIDINQIETCITSRTRAISVVHFLGVPVDMPRVMALARKHGVAVLEDCALAMGTRLEGVHAGLFGDCGCFSFYPVKHITTAEGGMLITRNEELARQINRKKAFGVDRHVGERKIPGVYEVNMLGYNYRMSEIQAALGIVQLDRIGNFLEKRTRNFHLLAKGISAIDEVHLLGDGSNSAQSSYYCMSVVLDEKLTKWRFDIVSTLNKHGIGTSVYYPRPVPHMPFYSQKYGYDETTFPVAARISYSSIALPVGPHLDEEDMQYIVENLRQAIAEVRK
jgi:perosamine synthetase